MVTIDRSINLISKFDGDLSRRRDYERAQQSISLIESASSELEETIKQQTGFDNWNLPISPVETRIQKGDIEFIVKSEATTKKPSYKSAAEGMEQYLKGISLLAVSGQAITGVLKEDGLLFAPVDNILEAYSIIVAGIMEPGVKHTIRYDAKGDIAGEKTNYVEVPENMSRLTVTTAECYVRMDRLHGPLEKFVKQYGSALSKANKDEESVVPINTRAGYTAKRSSSEGPNWAYVVQTLISVPTKSNIPGELNQLADRNISFEEKKEGHPEYILIQKEAWGKPRVYAAISSIYDRIQQLKTDERIVANRLTVSHKDIV